MITINNVLDNNSENEIPDSPSPEEIARYREEIQAQLGLKNIAAQKVCANLLYKGVRTWQQWENGDRKMDAALFELFLLKIGKLKLEEVLGLL